MTTHEQRPFKSLMEFTANWEGGYANDKVDRGGETKYGISKRSYPDLDIANLTREEADAIYERDFYKKPKFDQLPPELGQAAFDFGVNSGPRRATKKLQALVGVKQDGRIGPKTLAAIAKQDPKKLLAKYLDERETFVNAIVKNDPSQKKFLKGWVNRINGLRKELL